MRTLSSATPNLQTHDAASAPAAATRPREGWLVAAIPVLLLLPFLGSAFRIDDPLYLWAARQIQAHPLDPYGFIINWYGSPEPYSTIMKNPPAVFYYIALLTPIIGWSETALHTAFLLPTFLLGLGTYRLAARLGRDHAGATGTAEPAIAALAALLTPAVLVSSNTVMCDIAMTALFVWAVYLWIRGLDEASHAKLASAGLLIAAATLTKYFGLALVPLLIAYALLRRARPALWLPHFALPLLILAAFQIATAQLYGRGLLLDAASFSTSFEQEKIDNAVPRILTLFSFTGGGFATLALFAPLLWTRKALAAGLAAVALTFALIVSTFSAYNWVLNNDRTFNIISAQFAFWLVAGLSAIALCAAELRRRRDADTALLALWLAGTMLFAGAVNWITNVRSLLPAAIPLGILIARAAVARHGAGPRLQKLSALPLAFAALLSVIVVWADGAFAETARTGAEAVMAKYPPQDRTVWYRGHWGFQYYMDPLGAKAQDINATTQFTPHDLIVIPTVNANRGDITPPAWARIQEIISVPSGRWVATMGSGAGFYADFFGPVPFTFTIVPDEEIAIIGVRPELLRPVR